MSFFEVKIDDADIRGALQRLIALGADTAPAMKAVAAIGEKSSRMRFRTETGPDGKSWKPSLRAEMFGGRTLTKDGHLANSLSQNSGKDFAEWGVNRVYAAIHQFGGSIERAAKPITVRHRTDAKGNLLRSAIMNGKGLIFAKTSHKRALSRTFDGKAHQIKIPARPFLPVRADGSLYQAEQAEILAQIEAWLAGGVGA